MDHSFLGHTMDLTEDRGLLYGHGAFETMTVCDGHVLFLSSHLERLTNALERLSIPSSTDLIRSKLNEKIESISSTSSLSRSSAEEDQNKSGILKLIVTAGRGQRGYAPSFKPVPNIIIQWYPSTAIWVKRYADPINLYLCETRLALQPYLAGLKHLNRLEQVLAAGELQHWLQHHPSAAPIEGLVRDFEGFVIEAVSANFFIFEVDDQALDQTEMAVTGKNALRIVTPGLHRCGVAGVMRKALLDLFMQLGYTVVIEPELTLDRVMAAQGAMVSNCGIGIRRVNALFGGERNSQLGKYMNRSALDTDGQPKCLRVDYIQSEMADLVGKAIDQVWSALQQRAEKELFRKA